MLQGVKKQPLPLERWGALSTSSDLPGVCRLQPRGRAWGCMSPASRSQEGKPVRSAQCLPIQGCWERTVRPFGPAWSPPHPQALALTPPPLGLEAAPGGRARVQAAKPEGMFGRQSADAAPGREQTEAVCLGVVCSFSEEPRPGAPERVERRWGRQGGGAQAGGLSHGPRGGTPSSAPPPV